MGIFATDYLKNLSVDELAAWYLRLADGWDRESSKTLKQPLAGEFLRRWVNNRRVDVEYEFDAPDHLRSLPAVIEQQRFHREVFLTQRKGKFYPKPDRWVGVLPRIQGVLGFQKWDMKEALSLEYESLCDPAPTLAALLFVQQRGDPAEADITAALRGFQLKSQCEVKADPVAGSKNRVRITFTSWIASATDRYDWDAVKHLTVRNPDYQSKESYAVRPQDRDLTVYHTNAIRLEKAGRAAPFKVKIKPWAVTDGRVGKQSDIDIQRKL
jgi:hypothetical protein